jgi:Mn2+/Fe2+ NRAMP family transporter
VATVAVVGSTTVYALGWVALLIFPMLAVVQAIAARVGSVTRRDLGSLVRTRYGARACWVLVVSVVLVAVITLAADLKAGAAALGILLRLDLRWLIVPLAALPLAILWLGTYRWVRWLLELVALAFLTYLAAAFATHCRWGAVMHGSLGPSWRFSAYYAEGTLALLGTTLTSYVYVWETIELCEEPTPGTARRRRVARGGDGDRVRARGAVLGLRSPRSLARRPARPSNGRDGV